MRNGRLGGPPLYRALQDVYDEARLSDNTEVAETAQRLLTAAINTDRAAVTQSVRELQQACNLPFS